MSSAEICLLVAHDAGGAEILASYVVQNKLVCRFVLAGPALKVFQGKLESFELCSLKQGLLESTWCLCGTGWQSDLEWQAMQQARDKGMRVVAFIDHWVNYPKRFVRHGVQNLPSELWVGDAYAEQIAITHFPNTPIRVVDNPYLKDIKQEIDRLREMSLIMPSGMESSGKSGLAPSCLNKASIGQTNEGKTVLFVSENLSGHALLKYGDKNHFGYTEFDALELLLNNLECVEENVKTLVIRPHPSDQSGKYDTFLARYPGLIKISKGTTLVVDIVMADVVAGCESMALVVALLADKKVLSCITTAARCRLPHKEILMLKNRVPKVR